MESVNDKFERLEGIAVYSRSFTSRSNNYVIDVRKNQVTEAQRTRESLDKSWEIAELRRKYYEEQMNCIDAHTLSSSEPPKKYRIG